MATNKDTENNITKLTEVTEQDLAEAIVHKYGDKYSQDGKRLIKAPCHNPHYDIEEGTEIICEKAFYRRDNLTSINIPTSVTAIGHSAFCRCSSLTSITIPESVTTIGEKVFYGCSSLDATTKSEISRRFGDMFS